MQLEEEELHTLDGSRAFEVPTLEESGYEVLLHIVVDGSHTHFEEVYGKFAALAVLSVGVHRFVVLEDPHTRLCDTDNHPHHIHFPWYRLPLRPALVVLVAAACTVPHRIVVQRLWLPQFVSLPDFPTVSETLCMWYLEFPA